MLRPLTVLKVGGASVEDAALWSALAPAVAASGSWVVVHGGGAELTGWQRRLGLPTEWREGLRVTTDADMDVVVMVLSGRVNKRVVAALVGGGCRAVGVSGEDDGLVRAAPAPGLGRAGVVEAVDPTLLAELLSAGIVPVVSPVSRGSDGRPVNVNADDAACAVAVALDADRLFFVSDVPGVRGVDGELAELDSAAAADALGAGTIADGMAPKVRAALRASESGVRDVRVGDVGLLGGGGTRIQAAGAAAGSEGVAVS